MSIQRILEQHILYRNSQGTLGECASLSGADLSSASLSAANLRYAYLSGARLSGAYLRYAYLSGADLSGADLSGTYLRDADLRDVDLCCADLRDADLLDADLRGADLRGADLRGADLRGANLNGALLPDKTWVINGEYYPLSITNGNYLRAGCQCYPVEDWRKFSKAQIAEMDGKSALKFYPRLLDILDFYLGVGERPDWVK